MSLGAIAAVAAPIVGGIVGNQMARGDREAAMASYQEALNAYRDAKIPEVRKQQLALDLLKSQGTLTPQMEREILQSQSEMNAVSTDPRLKDAQLAALSQLQDISSQDGMSATDKSRFNQMQSENMQAERGSREAILQDMARRGQSGSGQELIAQLMNQQASAGRASQAGLDIKAQAEQRALDAIMRSGDLGGDIRSQDFDEQSRKAQAQDTINQFNTLNRQGVQQRNIGARNDAQAQNLAARQQIADSNVGLRNQQQIHNKGLLQQNFQNQLQRASGLAGQYQNIGDRKNDEAQRTAEMWAGIGSGAGKMGSAYGGGK